MPRLTSFTSTVTGNADSWTFGPAGNRLSQTVGGTTTGYAYNNADQLTAVNGVGVLTHANAYVLQDETGWVYSWDVRGRLSSLDRNGISAVLGYNQAGLRVRKLVNGVTTTCLLDGDQVVPENAGGAVTDLLQGPGTDTLLERGDNRLLHNCLNSTSGVTNGSGSLLQTYSYEPWGQASIVGGGAVQPYQFTGREADESGLMYYRARYYNPSWGRFGAAQHANRWANSPQLRNGGYTPRRQAAYNGTVERVTSRVQQFLLKWARRNNLRRAILLFAVLVSFIR